jgi:rSAM/selenodomain-associated transferase 2
MNLKEGNFFVDNRIDQEMRRKFSIIIPVLNESVIINDQINRLTSLITKEPYEIIVVDGDPNGETIKTIHRQDVVRFSSAFGRARQMNAGAQSARGEILIFLHADTELPSNGFNKIGPILEGDEFSGGAFDLGIKSDKLMLKLIANIASWRSRLTRIPYGDQGIFIKKDYFFNIGGFKDIPLMEDVELMKRIKKSGGKIFIIPERAFTSPRRWEKEGILYCIIRYWLLISLFYLGISPRKLAKYYPSSGSRV